MLNWTGFSSNLIIGVASTHFDKWLIDGSLEIIAGPNDKQNMKVDFGGTGFSLRGAYSVIGSFRPNNAFGPALTASYQFLSGRNPTDYSNSINGKQLHLGVSKPDHSFSCQHCIIEASNLHVR